MHTIKIKIILKKMNSMFDRLGEKLRSYLEKDDDVFANPGKNYNDSFDNIDESFLDDGEEKPVEGGWHYSPSFSQTFEEKNKFKAQTNFQNKTNFQSQPNFQNKSQSQTDTNSHFTNETIRLKPYPPILKNDFLKLGVTPGSPLEVCKTAQIKLLKQYHPDRAGNDEYGKMKATVMCSLVNESFSRIKNWYEHGKIN